MGIYVVWTPCKNAINVFTYLKERFTCFRKMLEMTGFGQPDKIKKLLTFSKFLI